LSFRQLYYIVIVVIEGNILVSLVLWLDLLIIRLILWVTLIVLWQRPVNWITIVL